MLYGKFKFINNIKFYGSGEAGDAGLDKYMRSFMECGKSNTFQDSLISQRVHWKLHRKSGDNQ